MTQQTEQQTSTVITGELMRSVGHELRNRLGVMKNSAYFLALKAGSADEKTTKHLQLLQSEIGTMDRMITDLMDLAWVKQSQPVPADLNAILSQSLASAPFPESTEVSIQFGKDTAPVLVDQGHLERVLRALWNLVAQQQQAPGGVEIGVTQKDDWAELRIRDGSDRDPTEGDPFELRSALANPAIGLSVATARQLVDAMSGTLEARPLEGGGLEYVLTLPLAEGPRSPDGSPAAGG